MYKVRWVCSGRIVANTFHDAGKGTGQWMSVIRRRSYVLLDTIVKDLDLLRPHWKDPIESEAILLWAGGRLG